MTTTTVPRSPKNGLAITLATLAGIKVLAASAVLVDILGPQWAALFLAMTGAADVGVASYVAIMRPMDGPRLPPPPVSPIYPPMEGPSSKAWGVPDEKSLPDNGFRYDGTGKLVRNPYPATD